MLAGIDGYLGNYDIILYPTVNADRYLDGMNVLAGYPSELMILAGADPAELRGNDIMLDISGL